MRSLATFLCGFLGGALVVGSIVYRLWDLWSTKSSDWGEAGLCLFFGILISVVTLIVAVAGEEELL